MITQLHTNKGITLKITIGKDADLVLWSDNQELVWLTAENLGSNRDALRDYVGRKKIGAEIASKLETAMGRCAECHSFEVGDSAKSPSLARIFGDPIASTGYPNYSAGLSGKSGRWTKDNLTKFLSNPQAFAPGTPMPPASDDPKTIEAIIDYLRDYDQKF